MDEDVPVQLALLASSLADESESYHTFKTLWTMLNNVRSHPEEAKYRHIRLSNKSFQSKLWRHELVRTILRQLGWVEEGDEVSMAEYKEGDFDFTLASLQEYMKDPPKDDAASRQARREDVTANEELKPTAHSSGTANPEYQKRLEYMREQKKKMDEEKRRITQQIRADRQETSTKESKPSHAREMRFEGLKQFKDIGLDLNKGGG